MKKKRLFRRLCAAALAMLLVFGLAACRKTDDGGVIYDYAENQHFGESSASQSAAADMEAVETPEESAFDADTGGDALSLLGDDLPADGRKIIRNASIDVETTDFESSLEAVRKSAAEADGYVESSSLYTPNGDRSADLTLRIPADAYRAFLASLGEAGSITRTEENTEDVTTQHIDVTARLNALKAQEMRLLELLEKSGTLEELIALQDRLSDVQYEIESYTAQLEALDDRIDYATVRVFLYEVTRYTPIEPSFGERIGEAFRDMTEGVGDGAESFVLWLIRALPALAILAAAAILITVLVKRSIRRHRAAQKAALQAAQPAPPAPPAEPKA